jgi:hypothetical protein
MTDHNQPAKQAGHGDYERSDIGIATVVYFLIGLALACVFAYFIAKGLYWYLDKRFEAAQTPVSPLVTNAPKDTRSIPPQYGANYEKYLKEGFPSPQLEVDERTELNDERLREANTLNTYGWGRPESRHSPHPDRARHGVAGATRPAGSRANRKSRSARIAKATVRT